MNLRDIATEVHESRKHSNPMLAFCLSCGKRYFVSFLTFAQTKGSCSCSWHCCPTAEPGNKAHTRHIAIRHATDSDISDAEAGIIKDFRNI